MNKQLFLTSKASDVLDIILPHLPKPASDMSVAFIPTAGNIYTDKPWQEEDRSALVNAGFKVEDVDIEKTQEEDLFKKIREKDIIFVAGGNTSYLLKKARESGFLEMARDLIALGKIYIGSSAGSLLAAENIELDQVFYDDKFGEVLESYEALGFVDFVVLPHANKPEYAPYHEKVFELYGEKYDIRRLADDGMIIVQGDTVEYTTVKKEF